MDEDLVDAVYVGANGRGVVIEYHGPASGVKSHWEKVWTRGE